MPVLANYPSRIDTRPAFSALLRLSTTTAATAHCAALTAVRLDDRIDAAFYDLLLRAPPFSPWRSCSPDNKTASAPSPSAHMPPTSCASDQASQPEDKCTRQPAPVPS
eukprot:485965-Pleurochrysis_carterae.AAC.1